MKHVKSLALCLLALALVLALAGCGGGKSDLPGTYKIDLDLAPALNSVMTQLGLAEEDLADLTLPVPYTLTLGEDGTLFHAGRQGSHRYRAAHLSAGLRLRQ